MRSRTLTALRPTGWPAWLATCAAFALLCAVIAYWTMLALAPPAVIAPSRAAKEPRALPDLQFVAQLFGVPPNAGPAVAPPSNIQVVGIVAAGRRGAAILAVDGKPGKPYAVGERITPSQLLAEVRADRVVIDTQGATSELPMPTRASLAVLTSGVGKSRADAAAGTPAGVPAGAAAGTPAGVPGVGMPGPGAPGAVMPGAGGSEAVVMPPPQSAVAPTPPPAAMPSAVPLPPGIVPVEPQRRRGARNDGE